MCYSFEKADVVKGRKIMGHTLRMLTIAPQLMRLHRIDDISAGNDVYATACGDTAVTFAELRATYGPIAQGLLDEAATSGGEAAVPVAAARASRRTKK